jgi:hypothetical protein
MIIVKDVPGLTQSELLEALTDLVDPGSSPIVTGHGGFVVDEDTAERFLSAYLITTGNRPPAPAHVDTEPVLARRTSRRAGTKRGAE